MKMYFITVNEDGKLVLSTIVDRNETKTVINSFDQLREIIGSNDLLCSSTLDFPDEYTTDQAVIDLCYRIRS